MAQSLKCVVDKLFGSYNDWRFILFKNWHTIIGPLQTHMRLERIDNDTLIIGVYDAHWMHELYMLTRTIIRTVNKGIGGNHVRHLRFRLVQRTEKQEPEKSLSHLSERALKTRSLTPQEQTVLERIKDPQLKESLYVLLQTLGARGGA